MFMCVSQSKIFMTVWQKFNFKATDTQECLQYYFFTETIISGSHNACGLSLEQITIVCKLTIMQQFSSVNLPQKEKTNIH